MALQPAVLPFVARTIQVRFLLMKRAFHLALLSCLLILLIAPAIAESAKSLYYKWKIADLRQNYEKAYDYY